MIVIYILGDLVILRYIQLSVITWQINILIIDQLMIYCIQILKTQGWTEGLLSDQRIATH